jgi:hypothetical protein
MASPQVGGGSPLRFPQYKCRCVHILPFGRRRAARGLKENCLSNPRSGAAESIIPDSLFLILDVRMSVLN